MVGFDTAITRANVFTWANIFLLFCAYLSVFIFISCRNSAMEQERVMEYQKQKLKWEYNMTKDNGSPDPQPEPVPIKSDGCCKTFLKNIKDTWDNKWMFTSTFTAIFEQSSDLLVLIYWCRLANTQLNGDDDKVKGINMITMSLLMAGSIALKKIAMCYYGFRHFQKHTILVSILSMFDFLPIIFVATIKSRNNYPTMPVDQLAQLYTWHAISELNGVDQEKKEEDMDRKAFMLVKRQKDICWTRKLGTGYDGFENELNALKTINFVIVLLEGIPQIILKMVFVTRTVNVSEIDQGSKSLIYLSSLLSMWSAITKYTSMIEVLDKKAIGEFKRK